MAHPREIEKFENSKNSKYIEFINHKKPNFLNYTKQYI